MLNSGATASIPSVLASEAPPASSSGAQESSSSVRENEGPVEGNHQPANWRFPEARIYMTDTFGMRVEHPSDTSRSYVTPSGAVAQIEMSSQHVLASPTTTDQEKINVLFYGLAQCQQANGEMKQKLAEAVQQNHDTLTQLNASKLAEEKTADENSKLKEELARKNDEINELKRKLQQQRTESRQSCDLPLRSGTKRGRFTMTTTKWECTKCGTGFDSAEAANRSVCSHHPLSPRQVHVKTSAEVFPEEGMKQCYWPCCRKFDTKQPQPCCHGKHVLRAY